MERLTVPDKKIDGGTRRSIIDVSAVKKEAMTIYWALKKYEDLDLTPNQIREIDKLYAEKCKEVVELQKELENSVNLPERLPQKESKYYEFGNLGKAFETGWNACLDKIKALREVKHERD